MFLLGNVYLCWNFPSLLKDEADIHRFQAVMAQFLQ